MPAFAYETKVYHLERVKRMLVTHPLSSATKIADYLKEEKVDPLKLDSKYVSKLIKIIRIERFHRFNHEQVKTRLADIEDKTNLVSEEMWKILLNATEDARARVMAGKIIIESEHKLLEAQMNAGVYTRKMGSLDVSLKTSVTQTHTLSPEILNPILRAFANHGIIKAINIPVDTERALTATEPQPSQ